MADIAAVFHWPPSETGAMSPEELAYWWNRARARVPGRNGGDPDA